MLYIQVPDSIGIYSSLPLIFRCMADDSPSTSIPKQSETDPLNAKFSASPSGSSSESSVSRRCIRDLSLEHAHLPDDVVDVLPRIRVLSLHMIGYLFQLEDDYIFMMKFLRDLLDWMEHQEMFLEEKMSENSTVLIDTEAISLKMTPSPGPAIMSSEVVDTLIEKCLDSDISDCEIAKRLDEIKIDGAPDETYEHSFDSFIKPLFIWQFMFDLDDYALSEFISPIRTENFGLIIKCMIQYTISTKLFDARIRTFIMAISHVLKIDYEIFKAYEILAVGEIEKLEQYKKKKERMSTKRMAIVSLAATGGAALMGLTGGLAAPFIASGIASIMGTSSAVFLATTAGVATITAVFGAVGGGLSAYKIHKVIGSIDQFEFVKIKEDSSVALTIVINGLYSEETHLNAWSNLGYTEEQYILNYETEHLKSFTSALSEFVGSIAVSIAAEEVVKYTLLASLAASLSWPTTIMSFYSLIDNPWTVCMKRSKAVGRHLSTVLMSKLHGNRPVNLIGYGFGGRVILFCLLDMVSKHAPEEYSGIVENAVLCGTPATSQPLIWKKLCQAVSGKVVNAYSSKDWVLSFLYKTTNVTKGVAGIRPIEVTNRKMVNIDLTSVVSGHFDYQSKMDEILKIIGMARAD